MPDIEVRLGFALFSGVTEVYNHILSQPVHEKLDYNSLHPTYTGPFIMRSGILISVGFVQREVIQIL